MTKPAWRAKITPSSYLKTRLFLFKPKTFDTQGDPLMEAEKKEMSRMRWSEIDKYLADHPKDAAVIIPIGPVEEHGPHLPVGSDYLSAKVLCELVAHKHHCLVFPVIPLMICGISSSTTGTYSVQSETLRSLARNIVHELVSKGFRQVFFFTGHGGYSMKVVREAIEEVHAKLFETSFRAAIFNFEEICPEQAEIVGVDERDIHAAGIETSRMMFLCPDDVYVDAIPPADYHSGEEGNKVLSASGISGDPSKASWENGSRITALAVSRIIEWLNA